MKKLYFFSFLLIISANNIFSQSGWSVVNPGFNHSYNSVHFINNNTGMACGIEGAIIKTTNAGVNWIVLNSGVNVTLLDIKMFSQAIAVAVGDFKTIIRTTDGGVSWGIISQNFSDGHAFSDLKKHNSTEATAFTFPDYMWRTTDAGINWEFSEIVDLPSQNSIGDMNTAWLLYTSSGTIYISKTTNFGLNWSVVYNATPGWPPFSIMNILFCDNMKGFCLRNTLGAIQFQRTINGGSGWGATTGTGSDIIKFVYFINTSTGWVISNSKIYRSSDSGVNWNRQQAPELGTYNVINFADSVNGWVASTTGLLKTSSGGFTGIESNSNEIPNKFALEPNYPNPFNPVTKIKFDIPKQSVARIIIYDLLGREVTTLVNEQLKPGTYEIDWDGTGFASGVYFYSLVTDEFTETKRMVLIK